MVACSMGRQVFGSRNLPDASPGKLLPVCTPNPLSDRPRQSISDFSDKATLAEPTLLDLCMICDTVIIAAGCWSWIFLLFTMNTPCSVLTRVLGRILPASIAVATVNGFIVEPGSNRSVIARLRIALLLELLRLLGLLLGL